MLSVFAGALRFNLLFALHCKQFYCGMKIVFNFFSHPNRSGGLRRSLKGFRDFFLLVFDWITFRNSTMCSIWKQKYWMSKKKPGRCSAVSCWGFSFWNMKLGGIIFSWSELTSSLAWKRRGNPIYEKHSSALVVWKGTLHLLRHSISTPNAAASRCRELLQHFLWLWFPEQSSLFINRLKC